MPGTASKIRAPEVRPEDAVRGVAEGGRVVRGPYERHGASRMPEYSCWRGMIGRCHNPNHSRYKWYGARGIAVAPAWRASFWAFYADMGPRPSLAHSLDRRDNDGPYTPENTRWATRIEQAQNRPDVVMLTAFGETHCFAEWARIVGIAPGVIERRYRYGWPLERALTQPVQFKPRRSRKAA